MATLGIDIGCISVKIAIVGEPEEQDLFRDIASSSSLFHDPAVAGRVAPHPGSPPVLATKYRRIKGSPTETARDLLRQVMQTLPEGLIKAAGVTGTGGRLVGQMLGLPYENEFKAIARAVGAMHPDVTTVFEMGGETSKFIQLETDADSGRVGIADYGTNGDCAAGTGSFRISRPTVFSMTSRTAATSWQAPARPRPSPGAVRCSRSQT
jgi:activator of 2-hydroxyglutaryl-CoA dehydratase